ncbi:MAG: RHS repeat-associated core domain-containing protein [Methylacidiphilales bacterium]|nr:RHS repeat-associated core domain-containing protein [Candidatus Methylacidiphilales bacterium]
MNRLGQRSSRAQQGTAFAASSTDTFAYNTVGELTGSDNDTNNTLDRTYAYDPIGNRTSATANTVTTSYTVNSLNQYTAISSQPSALSYDDDGNMTQYARPSDGKIMNLTWDAENRLLSIEPAVPQSGDKKIENIYDGQSRRVRKTVSTYNGSWSVTKDEKFLYDAWNLTAIYNANTNQRVETFTRGQDLAGSLLSSTSYLPTSISYAYTHDVNGNVSELVDGSDSVVAHYEYDPFGNATTSSGSYAETNVFRFSTKFTDIESGFLYYGYRFYSPELGRWPNRDSMEEQGGANLYGFVSNDPVNRVDYYGLWGTELDAKVRNHALFWARPSTILGAFSLIGNNAPPLTIESKEVKVDSTNSGISKFLDKKAMELCPCKQEVKVKDEVDGVLTQHLTLGRINVKLEGVIKNTEQSGNKIRWKYDGTTEPLTDNFDFNADPSRGEEIEALVSTARAAQTAGLIARFDINFTGPVKDNKAEGYVVCNH